MTHPSQEPDPRHEEFVRQLSAAHRLLRGYLVSLLGNRHDADDVLQMTSLTLWRKFSSFEPGTDFTAWACTVAFYEAKNFQRAAARSRLYFSEALMQTLADERPADLARTGPRHEALGHCLQKLDDAGRQLVEAAYLEEGSLLLLAEKLGRAPQTLYNKLNIIRRSLAECVARRLAQEGAA